MTINLEWPSDELETQQACPFCGSNESTLLFPNVKDWAFRVAPGSWNYWECLNCATLYLNPRPVRESIGRAYSNYYTHQKESSSTSLIKRLKGALRNEIWSRRYNANFLPRLSILSPFIPEFLIWSELFAEVFPLLHLSQIQPVGNVLDIGCGNGVILDAAKVMGWTTYGIEPDTKAALIASSNGHKLISNDFHAIQEIPIKFDVIICSHVIEHLHDPLNLLFMIKNAMKCGGYLFLSAPNSASRMREVFGENWRGLEAPRHITIPNIRSLRTILEELGFEVCSSVGVNCETADESSRIERRDMHMRYRDKARKYSLSRRYRVDLLEKYDFIKFLCRLK